MADIDIERAENLMESARYLLSQDDLAGVAGLAYQAFESALISLTSVINGSDSRTHAGRRKRAKVLLSNHRTKIVLLWEVRNVDFYGNIHLDLPRRKLTKEEAVDALNTVEIIIADIRRMLISGNP